MSFKILFASNAFLPLQPTRITSHSNALIDKIFSNNTVPNIILGNVTASTSNYLPQFSIILNMLGNISGNNLIFMKGNGQTLIKQIFLFLTIFCGDW